MENYLQNTNLDVLLLRIAYNCGFERALIVSGLKENPDSKLTVAEIAAKFESEMYNTAHRLAVAGFLKFEKMHPVLKMTLEHIKALRARAEGSLKESDSEDGSTFAEILETQLK